MQEGIQKKQICTIIKQKMPDYQLSDMTIEPLMGMTNYTVKVIAQNKPPLIFRYFGQGFDRKAENILIEQLARQKLAPKIFYSSLSYRIQQFVQDSKHPFCPDLFKYENSLMKRIALKTSEFHQAQLSNEIPRQAFLDKFFSQENQLKLSQIENSPDQNKEQFNQLKNKLLKLYSQAKILYKQNYRQNQKSKIKFCHNDLNNLNILQVKSGDIILIDYEYGCYNHLAYDLANFLNQFCFEYIQQEPAFNLYRHISMADIIKICQFYPNKYQGIQRDVLNMLIFCNLYWGIWCLKIRRTESSPNFRPLLHGQCRYQLIGYYKNMIRNQFKCDLL